MGSGMKPTIFGENAAAAVKKWHHTAKKHVRHSKEFNANTPYSSRPATPTHGMSPVHLLHKHSNYHHSDSPLASPRESPSNYENEQWYLEEGSSSPSNHTRGHESTLQMQVLESSAAEYPPAEAHHEITPVG